jgi:murein L,D-transpeptidase YafK
MQPPRRAFLRRDGASKSTRVKAIGGMIMRLARFLFASAALLFAPMEAAQAQPVPSTARSSGAEARVETRLRGELALQGLALGAPVFIRITKQPAELEVWLASAAGPYQRFRIYKICAFSGGLGPKKKEGDMQAPEGFYTVAPRQMNPASQFHLSFNLGYPNAFDRYHRRTGSALMVHGNCVSIGCYAMGDRAIEEIWTLMTAAFRNGQAQIPVHAFPFPLTIETMALQRDAAFADWIAQLRPAWDAFERSKIPPRIAVRNGAYVVIG